MADLNAFPMEIDVVSPPTGEIPAPAPWLLDEIEGRPMLLVRASEAADGAPIAVLGDDEERLRKFGHDVRRAAARKGGSCSVKRTDVGLLVRARK